MADPRINAGALPLSRDNQACLPWDALSQLAKTSIAGGLTADQMEQMASIMLQTAAEMRRAGLGGEMARA